MQGRGPSVDAAAPAGPAGGRHARRESAHRRHGKGGRALPPRHGKGGRALPPRRVPAHTHGPAQARQANTSMDTPPTLCRVEAKSSMDTAMDARTEPDRRQAYTKTSAQARARARTLARARTFPAPNIAYQSKESSVSATLDSTHPPYLCYARFHAPSLVRYIPRTLPTVCARTSAPTHIGRQRRAPLSRQPGPVKGSMGRLPVRL